MAEQNISILSIAPYGFLPPRSGGHQAIAQLHHHLGLLCNDHVVSTLNNKEHNYSFQLHKIFPNSPKRYLPKFHLHKIIAIAKEHKCKHIICEHPYMSFTAMAASKKLGIPWYSRSHNIEAQRFKALGKKWWAILSKYEQHAMQQANGVLFITEEDALWAKEHYKLRAENCHVIPFGTEFKAPPKNNADTKEALAKSFNISATKPWLYFLGALDYLPNEDAVRFIINHILPRLKQKNIDTEILIAGKALNAELVKQIESTNGIQYIGFVPDLNDFLLACDVMLNPVMTGGGIKTKAVEALGYSNTVISSVNGAAGITQKVCGDKLLITENYNWDAFTEAIIQAISNPIETPSSFYEQYYQGNIAQKVLSIIGY